MNFRLRYLPALLVLAGCDESLPPKNDTLIVSTGAFRMNPGIIEMKDSAATGLPGSFEGYVENTFNEVLQDTQRVLMTVDVWLEADPSQNTHLLFDKTFAVETQYLSGQILTLPPAGRLHVVGTWSQRTTEGRWFGSFVGIHGPFQLPGSGDTYYDTDTVRLMVSATVQGFKRVAALPYGPLECHVVYRIFP
jgi:hypothetical protein